MCEVGLPASWRSYFTYHLFALWRSTCILLCEAAGCRRQKGFLRQKGRGDGKYDPEKLDANKGLGVAGGKGPSRKTQGRPEEVSAYLRAVADSGISLRASSTIGLSRI